jgi:hypothetical protein
VGAHFAAIKRTYLTLPLRPIVHLMLSVQQVASPACRPVQPHCRSTGIRAARAGRQYATRDAGRIDSRPGGNVRRP